MCIFTDEKGNQLLDIFHGDEKQLIDNQSLRPLTSALIIVKGRDGFMLLKNRWRHEWELPGGIIEKGETPRQCALRECAEESGYVLNDSRFIGILKFNLTPDYFGPQRIEYSALYCADTDEKIKFTENNEITDLRWYNIGDTIENAAQIDIKLLDYYK